MKFDTIARNWLAINGSFDNFDWSLFTNSGISRDDYIDFCYYSAGYHGMPELGLSPSHQFRLCSAYYRGEPFSGMVRAYTRLSEEETRKALGLKKHDFGSLSLYWKNDFSRVTTKKLYDLLLQHLLNPSCTLLSVVIGDDATKDITLPQYLLYSQMNKTAEAVTVDSLLGMNFVSLRSVERARQAYVIGSSIYTPASECDLAEVLSSAYTFILRLCSTNLLKNVQEFTVLPLNECTHGEKASVVSQCTTEMARAASIGWSLNDIMHLFGLNIPDITYSISWFGKPTALNSREEFIQYNGKDKLMILNGSKLPERTTANVPVDIDLRDFKTMKEKLNNTGRIIID